MPTIAELEKQIYALKDQLQKARKENPAEPVKNYTFDSNSGPKTLSDLFGDKEFLYVIHNMGINCSYCTLWADTLNPMLPWLCTHAEVALCNMDDLETQAKMQASRGWNFIMVQDPDKSFSTELGYYRTYTEDGEEHTTIYPGISAFKKLPDGSIARLNHTEFGPGDDFCPIWPLWDLIGGTDWQPEDPKVSLQ